MKQINEEFLKKTAFINEYIQYQKWQEEMLQKPPSMVDLERLKKIRAFLEFHQLDILEKKEKAKEEWNQICLARTFRYDELGSLLASLLSGDKIYFFASRLIKHPNQIDKNGPFYQIVSFVTCNPHDLDSYLLDHLSKTMYPYYVNDSFIPKPLPFELSDQKVFEQLIERELEMRQATDIYVVTKNDILATPLFQKKQNQALLTTFPFTKINETIEEIIEKKYHQDRESLSKEKRI